MKPSVVVLFEDEGHGDLWPLAATRPVWDLRLGGHTLGDKLRAHFHDAQFAYAGRHDVIAAAIEEGIPLPSLDELRVRGEGLRLQQIRFRGPAHAEERLHALELRRRRAQRLLGEHRLEPRADPVVK